MSPQEDPGDGKGLEAVDSDGLGAPSQHSKRVAPQQHQEFDAVATELQTCLPNQPRRFCDTGPDLPLDRSKDQGFLYNLSVHLISGGVANKCKL